jgi:hypothetical protein
MKTFSQLPEDECKSLDNEKQKASSCERGLGICSYVYIRRDEVLTGILGAFFAGLVIGGTLVAAFIRIRWGN